MPALVNDTDGSTNHRHAIFLKLFVGRHRGQVMQFGGGDDEPVADLVPHQRASRIKVHPVLGKIKIGYDPVEPLATDEWPEAAR